MDRMTKETIQNEETKEPFVPPLLRHNQAVGPVVKVIPEIGQKEIVEKSEQKSI